MDHNEWFAERCPNGCFLIGKRTLGMVSVNDHLWPKVALRFERREFRLWLRRCFCLREPGLSRKAGDDGKAE